jgi:hypothetical protein
VNPKVFEGEKTKLFGVGSVIQLATIDPPPEFTGVISGAPQFGALSGN